MTYLYTQNIKTYPLFKLYYRHVLLYIARKAYRTVRRPFEKERLDQELKLCGEYGLRCKREIWRVQYMLSKVRKVSFFTYMSNKFGMLTLTNLISPLIILGCTYTIDSRSKGFKEIIRDSTIN